MPLLPGNLWPRWVSYMEAIALFFSSFKTSGAGREEDRALIQEALSGDEGFEKLVRHHERMVYRVAFRFLNDETDALDVAQEVFLRVHRSLSKFRGDSALSTWIYAITANLSRNAIRSKKNRQKVQVLAPEDRDKEGPSFWDKVADQREAGALRAAESKDLNGAIREAIAELPPDYREAVILRDLEGLDYTEIARALGTQEGTVKSRIARGRALLREKLKDWL
jgi:RNA polymerase sigma-70 factor, ECF subfamily